ncbi:UNVERIFIED_CONTAM: hypothetical protein HDU68_009597 [Siphonaria sp. JEL0065]|nr:hypothetical protein HDU68_009597 [Siphonaria sp. JEL0065]
MSNIQPTVENAFTQLGDSNILASVQNAFTQQGGYQGELGVLGAVAVAGAGYLAYEEWLAHNNKKHDEAAQAEFSSQVKPGYETQPEFLSNYAEGGKHHKKRQ